MKFWKGIKNEKLIHYLLWLFSFSMLEDFSASFLFTVVLLPKKEGREISLVYFRLNNQYAATPMIDAIVTAATIVTSVEIRDTSVG